MRSEKEDEIRRVDETIAVPIGRMDATVVDIAYNLACQDMAIRIVVQPDTAHNRRIHDVHGTGIEHDRRMDVVAQYRHAGKSGLEAFARPCINKERRHNSTK